MIDCYTWPTPNGHKVHIMLEECGLEWNVYPINIQEGDQFKAEFLKISPNNKMPAIIDRDGPDGPDGKEIAIFESAVILVYLGDKTGKFLPKEPHKYYDVMQWLMFQMGGVGPMLGQSHHFNAYARERLEIEKIQYGIDRYINEANRIYGVVEKQLDGQEWIAAGEYTIADMAIMPWLRDPAKQGVDIAKFPNVERWRDMIWARPKVITALETLAENRRRSNAHSDKAWDIMFGKSQASQGAAAE